MNNLNKGISNVVLTILLAWVIAGILSLVVGKAHAAGWVKDTISENKLTSIINSGDQGGVLKLTCDVNTKHLALQYMFEGKVYDFFIIRKFGDIDGNSPEGKIGVGMGTTTQAQVYKGLINNKGAISVVRFPVGTKAIWDKAIENDGELPPALEQLGEEFFLTGSDVLPLMNKIGAGCPLVPGDQTPIF